MPPIVERPFERFFEDFKTGDMLHSGTAVVTAERIKSFASEFDPQPFHLDEERAKTSLFGGLAASGWHTAAVTMRLLVDSDLNPAGGTVGLGGEDIRWPRPVRPGDVLRVVGEVTEIRPSRSRPESGIVKIRCTTYNQDGEPVQIAKLVLMIRRRERVVDDHG